jgi:hypothetical protein
MLNESRTTTAQARKRVGREAGAFKSAGQQRIGKIEHYRQAHGERSSARRI